MIATPVSTDPTWQIMPSMDAAEFDRLKSSIAAHGFQPGNEVVLDEDGRILDGHHRARACAELGIECPTRVIPMAEEEKWDWIYTRNLPRRHLTTDQKRALILEYVARHPGESNRAVAAVSGISDKTVARYRDDPSPEPATHDNGTINSAEFRATDNGTVMSEPEPPSENPAKHKPDEAWIDITIGYNGPSDKERTRNGIPYSRESIRKEWPWPMVTLGVPIPQSAFEVRPFVNDIAVRLYREILARPFETMKR